MAYSIGIIPARMASSRLPGKPLVSICGMPMVGHVYHRSKMSHSLDDVYIATCDQEIMDFVDSIGATGIMTADTHERATDRSAEALLKIEMMTGRKADIVVMIQGDEPLLVPQMIDDVIAPLHKDPKIMVANLMSPLKNLEEYEDPNEVKVVIDQNGFALYFSREPIPSLKKGGKNIPMMRQLAIIPFRRDFLLTFNNLPPTPLEIIESVDMLRLLEHGYKIKIVPTQSDSYSVDTPEDLKKVEQLMNKDSLISQYVKG
jgi:3-deoxy-manno-octulosonate cytidylyltransferase (CMP-KDO synthetase)